MSVDAQPASGDLLGMSDDEFLNLNGPPEGEGSSENEGVEDKDTTSEAGTETSTTDETEAGSKADSEDGAETDETVTDDEEAAPDADTGTNAGAAKDADPDPAKDKPAAKDATGADGTENQEGKAPTTGSKDSNEGAIAEPTGDQAMEFYKQVMAPFKANGKMIQLKDPSEVIQLMQMGANYTRKLQDIQPHRKVLLMLQNNDLLDEGKLSYLIDLDKKNPEAIKKLIKDAGIDPLDIDTSTDVSYSEGNHRVTDEEAGFRQVLDELVSSDTGKETVKLINTDWDQASKEVLWQSPEIMTVIHEQRENGVYDLITAELDRQKTLGKIPPNTPFLEAYKLVGDQLAAAGKFSDPGAEKKEPLATRAAAPKAKVSNGDKANAASPTRTTPRKVEKLVNPLAMSDDEFLKLDQFNGRV